MYLTMQRRILMAILGATAIGVPTVACRKETVTAPAPSSTSKICTASSYEKEEEMCLAPFEAHPRATGTGEAAPSPSQSAYDANGCLPKEMVSTGCCNPAMDGPRRKDGKCCYTVCTGSCCGRPFLVHGRVRIAHVAFGAESAWAAHGLPAAFDEALGNAWLRDAQLEHASAAAFGRFILQLLAVGAPADLVRRAAEAAADEVRHAELCFALAARYLGTAPSPAPLPLDGAFDSAALPAIVADVIAEGCVGETIAALIAARQLEGAEDDAVIGALSRIAEDEARHAELAWAFVRWAMNANDDVRAAARAAFQRVTTTKFEIPDFGAVDAETWRRHGRLEKPELERVIADALSSVIAPCAAALLA
jgi:hypothetical protein